MSVSRVCLFLNVVFCITQLASGYYGWAAFSAAAAGLCLYSSFKESEIQ